MVRRSIILGAFVLTFGASKLFGQADAWQRRWFWGAQAGVYMYSDPLGGGKKFVPTFGGHWMITGKQSALYIAFDQILFRDSTTSAVSDAGATATGGVRLVNFKSGRRIQAIIYAIPMDKQLQIMAGGGFAIHQITDAAPQGPFSTLQEAVNANNAVATVDTKAFFVFSGGVQYRLKKWAVFGQYSFMPSARDFLLTSTQHALVAGVRYSLTGAHEDVATEH